ncbi:hypothetical protein GCM10012290_11310 [Halolactibacillus alkaliphilus]|uniref:Uncharacterized protein n=1 Tax=Halolactibacillus alkaliphilus TaxID=442899 RepID=A0A511X396_9BACI|nr:hypothetical protein [Halolactibacillus alkaliphilus]GEN57395.1 hypothetical protein HAL01_18590 [Halolactibacillus alkaliphilus]GGN69037.1 hypothetical protein GCM10012290_11310 [Halolactibacillus alkaliphilus]SFO73582.1 hypothetical protein SAMN05720591_10770 [Halolactibacillus alkaliphilus]
MKVNKFTFLLILFFIFLLIEENIPKQDVFSTLPYSSQSENYQVKIKYVYHIEEILTHLYQLNGTDSTITSRGFEDFIALNNLQHVNYVQINCYYFFPEYKKTGSD